MYLEGGYVYLLAAIVILFYAGSIEGHTSCYDSSGNAQFCMTDFENIVFGREFEASNTCGQNGPQEYCQLTGYPGQPCDVCNSQSEESSHGTEYLTDPGYLKTWWQSESINDGLLATHSVNLTIDLGAQFQITYITIKFQSPRPASFAIYKKTSESGAWQPYQYYSSGCEAQYGVPPNEVLTASDSDKARCSDQHSDIYPFSGESVSFSTLEGRPGAYDFENTPVLQEWTKASAIQFRLDAMNTFGDEQFGDPSVLKSYFYAVSDVTVGGRRHCNGHGNEFGGSSEQYSCVCEHHTTGRDCERCLEGYTSQPWAPATSRDANECKQ